MSSCGPAKTEPKPNMKKARLLYLTGLSFICISLSGCGQKGPLFLPEPAKTNQQSQPPTTENSDKKES
ncbi:LPS translocon maturation chaperone LptM [Neptunicella marina]